MNFIEDNIDDPAFLSKGLYWTGIRDGNVSQRVENLILKAREKGKIAEIVGITQAFEGVDVELIQIQEYSS